MRDDLSADFQAELLPLEEWPTEDLKQQVFVRLDIGTTERHDELLDMSNSETLSKAKCEELDALRRQADLLMFRKAYAALILKWRGERVPTLAELEAAEE